MTTPKCKQTVIPTVDNTTSGCEECGYTDFKCIKTTEAILYWGIPVGMTLEDVFKKIQKDTAAKTKRISDLETALAALTLRVTALEP